MAVHIASRGLHMPSFYYSKITDIITIQTMPYSVNNWWNKYGIISVTLWFPHYLINTRLHNGLTLVRCRGMTKGGVNFKYVLISLCPHIKEIISMADDTAQWFFWGQNKFIKTHIHKLSWCFLWKSKLFGTCDLTLKLTCKTFFKA